MILRLCMAAVLIGCGLSVASARADGLLLSRDYFDRKVWRLPQNITDDIRSQIARGRFEPMARYQTGRYNQLGRAVGRLQFLTASGHTSACTGWLIAGDQVLTNRHCVAGESPDKRALQMRLALGVLDDRSEADIQLLPVVLPPLESDAGLDYAILRVEGDTSRFPPLSLSRVRDPQPGEALFLIGHPGGAPQHITRGGCQADGRSPISGLEFAHRCDTLGGNSGSPVFADDDGALVGLHYGGGTQANFAIRMEEIKRRSRILASLGSGPKSLPPPRVVNDRWVKLEGGKRYRLPVLENDSGVVGGALRVVSAGPVPKGRAEVAADGREILYTAPADAAGDVTFSYRVREEGGGEAEGVVTLSFQEAPTGPRVFRDCAECPEMVVVPAGSFTMGSPLGEKDRDSDEGPQRNVTIGSSLAVGRYEVTFAEWDACVAGGGCAHQPSDRGWGRGTRPVIDVNWNDAQAYVAWLSRRTGQRYRLLSEAEWEYAARAGTASRHWWGDDIGRNNANCYGCGSPWDGKQTAPVGSFKANPFGLHDMHGNVLEWVEDCSANTHNGAPSDGSARTGGNCEFRVLRSGSWNYAPRNLRSARRRIMPTVTRFDYVGFRVARIFAP